MAIVIAPEFGVALAMEDYLKAKKQLAEFHSPKARSAETEAEKALLNAERKEIRPELTMSHAFCANMGGFKVKVWSPSALEAPNPVPDRLYQGIVRDFIDLGLCILNINEAT